MVWWRCAFVVVGLAVGADLGAQTAAVISGTVVDSATGRPLPGTIVSFRSGDRVYSDRTDEEGSFRIDRVPPGQIVAELKRIGYRVKSVSFSLWADTTLRLAVASAPRTKTTFHQMGRHWLR